MADENLDQRLDRIEATLTEMRSETRTHFEGIDKEFNQLSEQIGAARRSTDNLREIYNLHHQMLLLQLQQMSFVPGTLDRVVVLLEAIVKRITDRDTGSEA